MEHYQAEDAALQSGSRRITFSLTNSRLGLTKESEGLKVLWQKFMMLSREKASGSVVLIEKEIEKRIKARLKK